jgi:hypothetical protein
MIRAMKQYARQWLPPLACWAAVLAALPALAAPLQPEAPPVPWRSPASGDAPRVLFVLPAFTRLDVAALQSATDLDAEVVELWDRAHLGFDPAVHLGADEARSAEAVERRLLEALGRKGLQAVVLGNLDIAALPAGVQERIAGQVRAGLGLVLSYATPGAEGALAGLLAEAAAPEDAPALLDGLPECDAPGGTPLKQHAEFLLAGEGRIAHLRYPGDIPATHALWPPVPVSIAADPQHTAHAAAWFERVLYWASRRDAAPQISRIRDVSPEGPNEAEIPPELTEAFVESMRDSAVAQPLRRVQIDFAAPLERGATVQVRVRKAGRPGPGYETQDQLGKGAELYLAQLLLGPGDYWIDARLLRKEKVEDWRSELITVASWPEITAITPDREYVDRNDTITLTVSVRSVFSTHRQATLYARAVDNLGRMVGQVHQGLTNEGGEARLRLHLSDLIAPFLRVEVLALDGPPRMLTDWDRYAGDERVLHFPVRAEPQVTALGLGVIDTDRLEPNNIAYLRRLSALGATVVMTQGGRPGQIAAATAGLRTVPLAAEYYVPTAVNGTIRVPGLHDPVYLANEEERLLDEVLLHYAGGGQAYSLGNPALIIASEENVCQSAETQAAFTVHKQSTATAWPWAEDETIAFARFRLFMEDAFAGFLGGMRGHLRAVDKTAVVGLRAIPRSVMRGYGWARLLERVDYAAADLGPGLPWQLSAYQPQPGLSGPVLPPEVWRDAQAAAWWPRHAAMLGLRTLWLDGITGTAQASPAASALQGSGEPDAGLAAFSAAIAGAETFAELLAQGTPVASPLVVLDSRFTQLAQYAESGGHDAYDTAFDESVERCIGFGHFPALLAEHRLASSPGIEAKVLLLPRGVRISPPVLAGLTRFAAAGGSVWHAAEVFDEYGVPLPAAEGWLNLDTAPREEVLAAMYDAGASPSWPLDREWLTEEPNTLLFRSFDIGAGKVHAAMPARSDADRAVKVPLRFGEDTVVLDRTTNLEVRRPHRASMRVSMEAPALLVELPYTVTGIEVRVPELLSAGDRLSFDCLLQTDTASTGAHPIKVTLHPPFGEPISGGEKILLSSGGRASGYFPTARNMIPGAYVVEAEDLLTGIKSEAALEVALSSEPGMQLLR